MLFFGNKRARNGEGAAAAVRFLEAAGMEVKSPPHRKRADVSDAIREHAGEADAVVVAGGDGSVNAAAGALIETGLPVGIIPMGTANDLARTLGLPTDPEAAVRVIAAGRRRAIDVGTANDHFFFNVASVGLAARVARDLEGGNKKHLGVLAYGAAAARLVATAHPIWAELETGGGIDRVRTMQISIGAGRHYGGGLTIDEDARPDDGKLRVVSLELDNWWELLPLVPALLSGRTHDREGVRAFSTDRLVVRTKRTEDVDLDGDLLTTTPVTFGIRHEAVEVFVAPPG
ncbi:MAG: lipid kinase [Bauldia sp.]|nr:lipid kinase [Bauldia sp.]